MRQAQIYRKNILAGLLTEETVANPPQTVGHVIVVVLFKGPYAGSITPLEQYAVIHELYDVQDGVDRPNWSRTIAARRALWRRQIA